MAKHKLVGSASDGKPVAWDSTRGMPKQLEFRVTSPDLRITLLGPDEAQPWQPYPLVQGFQKVLQTALKGVPPIPAEGYYDIQFWPVGVPVLGPELLRALEVELVRHALPIAKGRATIMQAPRPNGDEGSGVTFWIIYTPEIDRVEPPHSILETLQHPLRKTIEQQVDSAFAGLPHELDAMTAHLHIFHEKCRFRTIFELAPALNEYLWANLPKTPEEKRARAEKVTSILSDFQLSIIRGRRRCRLSFAANRWNVQGRFLLIPIGESKPVVTRAELADLLPFHLASAI